MNFNKLSGVVIQSGIVPILSEIYTNRPGILLAITFANVLASGIFLLDEEKTTKFINFIKDHKEEISQEIISANGFKEAFYITFENYLKQRNNEKCEIIKNIFLGFCKSENKEEFEMERLYDVINKIPLNLINLLEEFRKKEKIILYSENYKSTFSGLEITKDEYNKNYHEIKQLEYFGLLNFYRDQEITQQEEYEGDLESGIEKTGTYTPKNVILEYACLSNFGKLFINFIIK